MRLTDEQMTLIWHRGVQAGCIYEVVALEHPRLWPWSEIIQRASRHKFLRVAAWLWCGAWAWHFLVKADPPVLPSDVGD